MPIRLRLKEILEERGMSQRQLAGLTDTRPNTISHLCSKGVNGVYFETLEKICIKLDIDLHDLIVMEDD